MYDSLRDNDTSSLKTGFPKTSTISSLLNNHALTLPKFLILVQSFNQILLRKRTSTNYRNFGLIETSTNNTQTSANNT